MIYGEQDPTTHPTKTEDIRRERRFQHSFKSRVQLDSHGNCSLKRHYQGCPREVINHILYRAKGTPWSFVWESVKKIAAHCKNFSQMAARETYCQSAVEKSLALLRSQGIISDRYERKLGGHLRKGFDFLDIHSRLSRKDHGYCVFEPSKCSDILPKYGIEYGDQYVDAYGGKGSQSTVVSTPEYGIASAQNPEQEEDGAAKGRVCRPELLLEAPKNASKLYITPPAGTVQTVRTLSRSDIETKPFSDTSATMGKEKGIFDDVFSAARYYRKELEPFEEDLNVAYAMSDSDLGSWVKLLHVLDEVLKINPSPEFCAVREKIFAERGEYLKQKFEAQDVQPVPRHVGSRLPALVEEFLLED